MYAEHTRSRRDKSHLIGALSKLFKKILSDDDEEKYGKNLYDISSYEWRHFGHTNMVLNRVYIIYHRVSKILVNEKLMKDI